MYSEGEDEVVSFLEKHMNVDADTSKLEPQPGLCPRVIRMSIVLKDDIAV